MKRIISKILETKNVKPMGEKLMNSTLYKLVIFLAMGYISIMTIWNILFHNDFLTRTTLWITLLVTMALVLLSKVLNAIVKEGKKSKVVFWIAILLMHFVGFVFLVEG